jgi:hypothetical protein
VAEGIGNEVGRQVAVGNTGSGLIKVAIGKEKSRTSL